jgi:hypothetical protein
VHDLATEIAALATLSAPALRGRWATTFGRPAPRRLSRQVLLRALTWHLQADRFGGVSASSRRRLADGGRSEQAPRAAVTVTPGTTLLRDWQGETHRVEVLADGFRWRGERYRSLSVIATRITGTRWSGPRFFGLRGG